MGRDNRDLQKNKKKRELGVIKVQDQKIGRKYRKKEQEDKNDNSKNNNNNKTHTQILKRIKRRVRSKGNRIEDRQRMKVEKSKEGKQKTKKVIEAERKIRC